MKASTLKKCIQEARRFIEKAEQVPIIRSAYEKGDWMVVHGKKNVGDLKEPYIECGSKSGAANRASMDLSRCLADLRQNR